ncbi:hypothetical protein A0J61_10886 [Choanephora cucurbitarum]|uniref:DDE Tnp4 domain-containing protein n=1 Tax=Choanephora cucurbitarum TaxID=101091 RepID=A0A1C7MVZ6_9FUNG|nr:hypothetical protein A0J61_10886 [Choanephora cucurbitarum]
MKIRLVCTGWAGSTHDARVFANSPLMEDTSAYFDPNEYILADSAYPCLPHIVPAYRKTSLNGDSDNTRFNKKHSRLRVKVEHCIGLLKTRWMSLRVIRRVIKNETDAAYLCLWIRTCVVLHNLLIGESDDGFQLEDTEAAPFAPGIFATRSSMPGLSRREEVKYCVLNAQNHQ